jgi:hypothetical protein
MERVQEEQGKALESFQPKPDCEVEGEKKRGKVLVTLRGRGKVVFIKMDKFERWVRGRDVHSAKHVRVFYFFNIRLTPIRPLMKEWL